MLSLMMPADADAWWWKPKKPKAKKAARRHKKAVRERKKAAAKAEKPRKYIAAHDFNKDGRVDKRDTVFWVKNHKDNSPTIYVSTENEDLYDVVDIDNDGDVEQWEMKRFYNRYDDNKDGVLDENEIDRAVN